MIKASGHTPDGRRALMLGLSYENLGRLRAGQPIKFDGKACGYDGEIVIFAGRTEAAMVERVMRENPGLRPTPDPEPT